jgi:pimeloyl-ACP methyl ester carboxylesterase
MPLNKRWTGLAWPSSTSPGIRSVPGSHSSSPRGAVSFRSSRSLPTGWALRLVPGYLETVRASMFDVPTRLERISCPVLLMQGTADPLVSMQSPRFLAFIRHAQMQWLPGLSHVPISDDPRLVASIMLRFLETAPPSREPGRTLSASPVSSRVRPTAQVATLPTVRTIGPVIGCSSRARR